MVLLRLAIRAIGLVSTVVLARLLVPADFGLVAMATALSGALAAMSEFGFGVALIQNQTADRRHYDTAWTLGLIRGLLVAGALAACADPLASAFSDQRLEPILHVLAVGLVITSLENIAVVEFRKHLQFHKEFVYRSLAKIASFTVTLPLAIILRNYWALVVGILTGQIAGALLSYSMCVYRPRLSIARWRELMRFSKWLLLNSVLSFVYSRTDTFVIGRFAGAGPLGLYGLAHEIASLPTTEVIGPIQTAILPGYAKLVAGRVGLGGSFAGNFALIVMIALPIALGLGLMAEPLVELALGEHWLEAVPLLEVLCIYGAINVCTANTWPVFIALGRPWIGTFLTGLSVIVLVPSMFVSVQAAGALGVAWTLVSVAAVLLAGNLFAALRLLQLPASQLVAQTWRAFVAVLIMAGTVLLSKSQWDHSASSLNTLLFVLGNAVIGAAAYLAALSILWWLTGSRDGPERTIISTLRSSLSGVPARYRPSRS
jgi:lipopolysaccharide exporter